MKKTPWYPASIKPVRVGVYEVHRQWRGLAELPERLIVMGYYAAGDGGAAAYRYDPTDTTRSDNGGELTL